ncbi:MAG: hypothetical protein R3E50_15125 [Halioglobus sp.]
MTRLGAIADAAIGAVLPYACAAIFWPFACAHRLLRAISSREKRVLLVARNEVAADYMLCIKEVLDSCEGVHQFTSVDRFPARGFDGMQAESMLGVTSVHIMIALFQDWDLIVFTNHPYGLGICFAPWLKKLYVNHGLHSGKINNDKSEDGVYGSCKTIRPFGRPYYHSMFASSYWEQEFACRTTPALRGRVSVVGFIRADMFMEYMREYARKQPAVSTLAPGRRTVHIISTWGPGSLYAICGEWLLDQVRLLHGKYDFVVSIHPRFDDLAFAGGDRRATILDRFQRAGARVNPGLDWDRCIVSADVAICDHSSLTLYHLLAGHPVILADVHDSQYVEGSSFDLLAKRCQKLSQDADLEQALHGALSICSRSERRYCQANARLPGLSAAKISTGNREAPHGVIWDRPVFNGGRSPSVSNPQQDQPGGRQRASKTDSHYIWHFRRISRGAPAPAQPGKIAG